MRKRSGLHLLLTNALESSNVFFQPSGNTKLTYPCIIYNIDDIDSKQADNIKYIKNVRYVVTFITKNPDSPIIEKLEDIESSSFDRHYTADNLHHYVYKIYY